MKVVINDCFGGFSLSEKVLDWLKHKKQISDLDQYEIARNDPDLIEGIETFKEESGSKYSKLKIVEIPDNVDYIIEEYDGKEWIAEKHLTWR